MPRFIPIMKKKAIALCSTCFHYYHWIRRTPCKTFVRFLPDRNNFVRHVKPNWNSKSTRTFKIPVNSWRPPERFPRFGENFRFLLLFLTELQRENKIENKISNCYRRFRVFTVFLRSLLTPDHSRRANPALIINIDKSRFFVANYYYFTMNNIIIGVHFVRLKANFLSEKNSMYFVYEWNRCLTIYKQNICVEIRK